MREKRFMPSVTLTRNDSRWRVESGFTSGAAALHNLARQKTRQRQTRRNAHRSACALSVVRTSRGSEINAKTSAKTAAKDRLKRMVSSDRVESVDRVGSLDRVDSGQRVESVTMYQQPGVVSIPERVQSVPFTDRDLNFGLLKVVSTETSLLKNTLQLCERISSSAGLNADFSNFDIVVDGVPRLRLNFDA
jgi:hypothetical protein